MKRKVEQRAYAHARSNSGSEECDKVRRTGCTLCSAGVPRSTLPCSLRLLPFKLNSRCWELVLFVYTTNGTKLLLIHCNSAAGAPT